MPIRNRFAGKLLRVLSREMPENAAHAEAEPAQLATESDPLPRPARSYSAENDHGPLKTISTPPPVIQPVEAKPLPPLNAAMDFAGPAGVYVRALPRAPPAMIAPTLR